MGAAADLLGERAHGVQLDPLAVFALEQADGALGVMEVMRLYAGPPNLMHFMPFTHNQKVSCIIFRTLLRKLATYSMTASSPTTL